MSSQGIEGYGRGPLWKRRPALGCSANEEEEIFRGYGEAQMLKVMECLCYLTNKTRDIEFDHTLRQQEL